MKSRYLNNDSVMYDEENEMVYVCNANTLTRINLHTKLVRFLHKGLSVAYHRALAKIGDDIHIFSVSSNLAKHSIFNLENKRLTEINQFQHGIHGTEQSLI